MLKNDDGSFSMKSSANGKFVSANPNRGGILISQGSKVDAWERFDIRDVPGKPKERRLANRCLSDFTAMGVYSSKTLATKQGN